MAHWLEIVLVLLQAPTKDLRELAHLAGADPRTFYLGVNLADLDTEGQDLSGMEFANVENSPEGIATRRAEVTAFVAKIHSAARQEERVAMIFDAILHNRVGGLAILDEYQSERAKFATYALKQIRALIADKEESIKDESVVAALIPHLFTYTFPLNRGRLLYFMAVYLAKYPEVNASIKKCLQRTASMFVEEYRAHIEKLLMAEQIA